MALQLRGARAGPGGRNPARTGPFPPLEDRPIPPLTPVTPLSPAGPGSPLVPLARGELAAVLRPGEARGRLDALLAGLNAPQRAAATRPDGPLLVVAGPGAGKTRVIAARVAYLLLGRGVPPGEVAAITFSRRAAGELEGRLAALAGAPARVEGAERVTREGVVTGRRGPGPDGAAGPRPEGGVWAGTFHALGARILRRGGAAQFERPPGFTIYDAEDTERTLRRVLGALGVPANRVSRLAPAAGQAISLAKRQRPAAGPTTGVPTPTPEMIGEEADELPLEEVLTRYDAALQEAAAFDFDDLVGLAAVALDRDPALRAWARAGTRHLLVDEYQDTDPAQEALLRRLAPPAGAPDLCVVADPQQSIYAFRGAAPEQVRRFLSSLARGRGGPPGAELPLHQVHRRRRPAPRYSPTRAGGGDETLRAPPVDGEPGRDPGPAVGGPPPGAGGGGHRPGRAGPPGRHRGRARRTPARRPNPGDPGGRRAPSTLGP